MGVSDTLSRLGVTLCQTTLTNCHQVVRPLQWSDWCAESWSDHEVVRPDCFLCGGLYVCVQACLESWSILTVAHRGSHTHRLVLWCLALGLATRTIVNKTRLDKRTKCVNTWKLILFKNGSLTNLRWRQKHLTRILLCLFPKWGLDDASADRFASFNLSGKSLCTAGRSSLEREY